MPPADSTAGCAAHGPISTARERSMGMAHEMLTSTLGIVRPASLCLLLTARAGKGFQPSAGGAAPRFPHWMRKARSLSTRLGPARPPPGRSFREPCDPPSVFLSFFLEKVTKWVFGPLLVHVLGSRNYHSASRSLIQANRSLGPARPPGTRRGEISESLVVHLFPFFFGRRLLVHVLGQGKSVCKVNEGGIRTLSVRTMHRHIGQKHKPSFPRPGCAPPA